MNQLNNLKKFSTVVADTGNVEAIQKYAPQDATTNPSLIFQAVSFNKNYQKFLKDAISYAQKKGGNKENKIINANNKLLTSISNEILKIIPGSISTEIDARFSYNQELSIQHAIKLINMYKEENIDTNRILIKLAATWEGIKAAKELKKYGIKCNLTLLFSFAQAKACAESSIYLISPFVGRIYDWYNQYNLLKKPYTIDIDPGVQAVQKIFKYYKKYNYKTIIMAASFRNANQILALAGCDRLTVSPNLLKLLHDNKQNNIVKQKLFLPPQTTINTKQPLSKEKFQQEHNLNIMAVEKLNEGIHQFIKDQKKLENLLIQLL